MVGREPRRDAEAVPRPDGAGARSTPHRDAGIGSAVVFGVVRLSDDGKSYFNSVLALDERVSWYDKRHLVPFAEFFPVPGFIRSWLRLMSLPYSDFTSGGADQPPLPAAGL